MSTSMEFDQEFLKRGVPCIRYADDIVLLAKSKRASERLLESSTKYLEGEAETYSQPRKEPYCQRICNPEILNSLALHWEGTEKAFMSEFIRSHGRSLSLD